ncbi:Asp-tRNA(Asn)/Glu-tRNA(Gln) amidotransferase subunit GatB [bacterium]|nr:Asp-tRNA(Asn)/Glu-tRNA(Gln) amidotransferase subunit GatB [bacterium]
MRYESVIGLEIHAQLLTQSKLFCGCSTRFGSAPNTQTCPVCLGFPGVLPVFNRQVAELALKTALALHSDVPPFSLFARKNYFYPDLPKAYQISQYELPFARGGFIEIDLEKGGRKRICLTRIHLEEDAGKLIHGDGPDSVASFVDFNRTGVPLLEIVTEPDIRSPQEAKQFLQNLKAILTYLKVCDGNMEEGSLRCDANVSVRPCGQKTFGVKTEIKNMNSFRNVQKALEYEIDRQITMIEGGEDVIQETRLWDADKCLSFSMRTKEEAHDYRYFPEPDLIPVRIDGAWIEQTGRSLPELPEAKKSRLVKEYGISSYNAQVLTSSSDMADYFEECCRIIDKPQMVSNWIMVELLRELNRDNLDIASSPIKAKDLADMLKMMDDGLISGKIAKTVFTKMYKTGKKAAQIVQEENLTQITDQSELEKTIDNIIRENPGPVSDYREGKKKTLGFLIGQVMKASHGKANPELVNRILIKKLEDRQ